MAHLLNQKKINGINYGAQTVIAADISKEPVSPAINRSTNTFISTANGNAFNIDPDAFEKSDNDILINFTDDLLWSVNSDFKLITANRAFINDLEDAVCMTIDPGDDLLMKGIFPDRLVSFWQTCYQAALDGQSFKKEIYAPAFNKRKASWRETSFNPIYKAGAVTGIACFSRNITERKLADEKLRKSETHLAEAQRLAKLGSWNFDIINDRLTWSDELYHVFGTDKKIFTETHHSFTELIDEKDRELVLQTSRHTQETGEPFTIEYNITTPKGEKLVIQEHGYGEIGANGKVVRLFGTAQDITERKKNDEAIRMALEERNTVLERIDDGFFAVDKNSVVTYWNKRAETLLDAKREEVIGKNLHEVFASTASRGFHENYQKAIRENTTVHFTEFSTRTAKWFAVSAYGSDNGLSVYFKDVTEQKTADEKVKESELRYRSIIEQATDVICIADASQKFIDINPYACHILGYSKEEALQLSIADIVFTEDLKTNPFKFDQLKPGRIISNERRIKGKDGTSLVMEVSTKLAEDGTFIIFGHDVSERRESERLIKESEAKYRSFFESSMDGILLTVTDGEILSANPAACEIFKMSEAEICAAGRFGIVDSSDPRVKLLLEERQRTGRIKGEITLLRKDGSKFEAELTSSVFTDSFGQDRTSMIVRDITERKQAELRIKESNERYNLISRATNDMVWDWDLVTGKVYRNKEGWKKIFRTGNKEVKNELIEDWDNKVHPDDKDMVNTVADEIQNPEKDFFEVECRVQRDDGSYAYIHDRGNIVRNDQGKAIRVIGATQDITKRKEAELQLAKSELRFRSLVQNSSELICIFNDRGYFMYSSPAIKQMLGFDPEDTIEKNAFALVHEDDIIPLKDYLWQMNSPGHQKMPLLRFKNTLGDWRWIESKVTDMSDNPEVAGYVFNCRDITERILLEKELEGERLLKHQEITQAVISAQERERQELGGELHDNVNQILAGSLLYLGLAKRELNIDHPYLTETDTLINSAIEEIRNLSHSLIPPSLHESEFLDALINIIESTQKTSGIFISLQACGFDESSIPDRLKLTIYRIVQEQLNNILKHAAAQKVIIHLVKDNEKTLLSIKDDGAGFDTTKKANGVGLMNIKTRASLFNGDIAIISSPGKGCELRVLFN